MNRYTAYMSFGVLELGLLFLGGVFLWALGIWFIGHIGRLIRQRQQIAEKSRFLPEETVAQKLVSFVFGASWTVLVIGLVLKVVVILTAIAY